MAETSLGLRTVIYRVPDLEKAKTWYGNVIGLIENPHFKGVGG